MGRRTHPATALRPGARTTAVEAVAAAPPGGQRFRAGSRPPNHCRRSTSISAWPGDQPLLARAGCPCVFGAPRRGFWVLRRSRLATAARCAAHERDFRVREDGDARLTHVQHPPILGVGSLKWLSFFETAILRRRYYRASSPLICLSNKSRSSSLSSTRKPLPLSVSKFRIQSSSRPLR